MEKIKDFAGAYSASNKAHYTFGKNKCIRYD